MLVSNWKFHSSLFMVYLSPSCVIQYLGGGGEADLGIETLGDDIDVLLLGIARRYINYRGGHPTTDHHVQVINMWLSCI